MQIADSLSRAKALDPEKSFIVDSPAGSGKTELLIQRHLNLLSRVRQPESVLAITFTRKAAGEMRRRILAALRNSAAPRPEKEHEALTWDLARKVCEKSELSGWRLPDNPGRLRIQTIDSLCAAITRQMPWLSRLGGPSDIIEDGRDLYAEASQSALTLLENEEWSPVVGRLLLHLDNNMQALANLISGMLAKRDQWLRHLAAKEDPARSRAALELSLQNVFLDSMNKANQSIPPEDAFEIAAIVSAAAAHLAAEGKECPANACLELKQLPDSNRLDLWLGIADTLLTKDGEWRKRFNVSNGFPPADKILKQRGARLMANLLEKGVAPLALDELRRLPDERFSESQWQVLSALVKLLPAAVANLQALFRERGVADYVEVAMAARRALGETGRPTDLARSLDYQIQHILIDEFQDTSVSQYSLLEALISGWKPGDGRTVFAVGDPKQSIYRFREAEVGLFLKTRRDGIGAMPLELIPLSVNFRSEKGIVDWVNESFPGILSSEEDITAGAIPFRPSTPGDSRQSIEQNGAVSIHPFFGRNDRAEADRVVEIIRAAIEKKKKAAILVRARSHLARIIPALRSAGIRFRAVDIDPLAEVPAIQDLTALTRALLHHGDRIAWLAILRAPWCGMTLEELHIIAGGDLKSTIWDLINEESRIRQLTKEGRRRLNRIRCVLEKTFAKHPVSLRTWIESAWLSLGGPACNSEKENAAVFFDLLEKMDQGGKLDMNSFERRIRDLYAKPDPEADESVQIMSIHKAKGLEFDVVVAPGLGHKPRRDEPSLMMWLERPRLHAKPDLLLAPIHAIGAEKDKTYDYLKGVEALKSEHELGRLLYVAATRAKSSLHFLGHTEFSMKDGVPEMKKPAAGSLLERMWNIAEPAFVKEFKLFQPPPADQISEADRTPRTIQRLPLDWEIPAMPPSAGDGVRSSQDDMEETAVSFHWVGDMLRHIGTVVHRMLKRIAEDGISYWNPERVRNLKMSLSSELASLGVSADELPAATDRVESALAQAVIGDRGRWLLGTHSHAACEYSISGIFQGGIVNVRIDRTFVDGQGVRWIIDYKSSSHEGAGMEEFLDNERERYRAQLARYRSLFSLLDNRPIRTALYFPLLNAWREVE